MTKQHVFGKRLLAFLDDKLGDHHFSLDTTDLYNVNKTKVPGNIWSRRLRRVCGSCNNGWMRCLEESSFDIITSLMFGGTHIASSNIGLLCARLSLLTMVADLTIDEKKTIDDYDRLYLKLHGVPPSEWLMFLCRADVDTSNGQYYHADGFKLVGSRGSHTVNIGTNFVATFLLGKLCVHIITRPPIGYHSYTGARLVRAWPSPGRNLDLSESSLLSPQGIIELGFSFRKFHAYE